MNRRFHALLGPGDARPLPAAGAGEAVAMWLSGVLWMGVCVLVARLNLTALLPAVLTGGVVMAWGGRQLANYVWFPLAATAAVLVEPLASAGTTWRAPLLTHLDLVVLAALVLVPMRVAARRRHRLSLLAHLPAARFLLVAAALVGLQVVGAESLAAGLRSGVRALAAFGVALVICNRPRHPAGLWSAVALLSGALVGGALLAATHGGLPAVVAWVTRVDHHWHGPHALVDTLVFAAPVTFGYSLDRSRAVVRWGLGLVALGAITLAVILVASGGGWWSLRDGASAADLLRFLALGVLLVAGVAGALRLGSARPAERGSWTGLALAYALLALGGAQTVGLTSTPIVLFGGASAGAVVSALDRARRRHARVARVLAGRDRAWRLADEELGQAA